MHTLSARFCFILVLLCLLSTHVHAAVCGQIFNYDDIEFNVIAEPNKISVEIHQAGKPVSIRDWTGQIIQYKAPALPTDPIQLKRDKHTLWMETPTPFSEISELHIRLEGPEQKTITIPYQVQFDKACRAHWAEPADFEPENDNGYVKRSGTKSAIQRNPYQADEKTTALLAKHGGTVYCEYDICYEISFGHQTAKVYFHKGQQPLDITISEPNWNTPRVAGYLYFSEMVHTQGEGRGINRRSILFAKEADGSIQAYNALGYFETGDILDIYFKLPNGRRIKQRIVVPLIENRNIAPPAPSIPPEQIIQTGSGLSAQASAVSPVATPAASTVSSVEVVASAARVTTKPPRTNHTPRPAPEATDKPYSFGKVIVLFMCFMLVFRFILLLFQAIPYIRNKHSTKATDKPSTAEHTAPLQFPTIENPFWILELKPDASRMDIERAGQKILALLNIGNQAASSYSTPFGNRTRNEDDVRQALAQLRDPNQRVQHELWYDLAPQAIPTNPDKFPLPHPNQVMGWSEKNHATDQSNIIHTLARVVYAFSSFLQRHPFHCSLFQIFLMSIPTAIIAKFAVSEELYPMTIIVLFGIAIARGKKRIFVFRAAFIWFALGVATYTSSFLTLLLVFAGVFLCCVPSWIARYLLIPLGLAKTTYWYLRFFFLPHFRDEGHRIHFHQLESHEYAFVCAMLALANRPRRPRDLAWLQKTMREWYETYELNIITNRPAARLAEALQAVFRQDLIAARYYFDSIDSYSFEQGQSNLTTSIARAWLVADALQQFNFARAALVGTRDKQYRFAYLLGCLARYFADKYNYKPHWTTSLLRWSKIAAFAPYAQYKTATRLIREPKNRKLPTFTSLSEATSYLFSLLQHNTPDIPLLVHTVQSVEQQLNNMHNVIAQRQAALSTPPTPALVTQAYSKQLHQLLQAVLSQKIDCLSQIDTSETYLLSSLKQDVVEQRYRDIEAIIQDFRTRLEQKIILEEADEWQILFKLRTLTAQFLQLAPERQNELFELTAPATFKFAVFQLDEKIRVALSSEYAYHLYKLAFDKQGNTCCSQDALDTLESWVGGSRDGRLLKR